MIDTVLSLLRGYAQHAPITDAPQRLVLFADMRYASYRFTQREFLSRPERERRRWETMGKTIIAAAALLISATAAHAVCGKTQTVGRTIDGNTFTSSGITCTPDPPPPAPVHCVQPARDETVGGVHVFRPGGGIVTVPAGHPCPEGTIKQ
jgi:hypothetical protein